MRRLVLNTALNFIAFGTSGLIGLALAPVIVAGWGLQGYGLVVLARMLFPSGLFGVFDLGIGDAVTRHVAAARAGADAAGIGRLAGTAAAATLVVSLAVGAGVFASSDWLARTVLAAPEPVRTDLAAIVALTGLAMPLLFLGAVAEGVFKGFERYAPVRLAEIAAAAGFAIGTLWLARDGAALRALLALQLAVQVARAALVLMLAAAAALPHHRWRHFALDRGALDALWRYGRPGISARVAGLGLIYGPPLLLARLAGPAEAGVYDAIMRLPRFAKIALGLVNGALLPTATRLDAASRAEGLRAILDHGTRLSLGLFGPVLLAGAVLAQPILALWLGPALATWWPWLALGMLWAFVLHTVGTASAVAGTRAELVAANARWSWMQLVICIGVGAALAPRLGAAAFVVSTTLAALLTLGAMVRAYYGGFAVDPGVYRRSVVAVTIAFLPAGALLILAVAAGMIQSPPALLLAAAAACAASWLAIAAFGLRPADRAWALRALQSLRRAPRLAP
jgi:O-antigen/teichoic acid export membrane protein